MKKIIVFISVLFSALLMNSCQTKEETKISYEISAASVHLSGLEDLAKWSYINNVYSNEISKLGYEIESGSYYTTIGFPDECDDLVLSACKVAEASLSDVTLEGYVTVQVEAIYWNNGERAVIYTHKFGQE